MSNKEENIRIVLTYVENHTMSKDDALALILALTDGDRDVNGSCEIHQAHDEIIRITDEPSHNSEVKLLND